MIRACMILIGAAWAATANAAEPAKSAAPVQTLDAITIEGDVAVPQVLFITSRDHPRHREDLGRQLRPGALAIARGASAPVRLVVISDCPNATIKEQ